MKQNNLNLVFVTLLIIVVFYVTLSNQVVNNPKISNVLNKLTSGSVNTLLLLLIIGLTLSEDVNIGFLLAVVYLVVLIRTNKNKEGFESGPSPLDCKTYGNSREKTGVAYYPLHAQ
tara:strand:+ start:288 stop:635 length:348 start_codon:yes stop_codon:yes gene_type:complete